MPLNIDLSQGPFIVEMWESTEKSAKEYVAAKFKAEEHDTKYKPQYDAKFKADFDAKKAEMNAKFQANFDALKAEMDAKFKAEIDAKKANMDTFTKSHVLAIENMLKLGRFSAKEIADLLVVPIAFVTDIQAKMSGAIPVKASKSRKK